LTDSIERVYETASEIRSGRNKQALTGGCSVDFDSSMIAGKRMNFYAEAIF
jgi:hypothetical protein